MMWLLVLKMLSCSLPDKRFYGGMMESVSTAFLKLRMITWRTVYEQGDCLVWEKLLEERSGCFRDKSQTNIWLPSMSIGGKMDIA